METRFQHLESWVNQILNSDRIHLTALPHDASFRRYFRAVDQHESFIIMDAPPEIENCHPFVAIGKAFEKLNIHVPHIYEANVDDGFLLIEDLGYHTYLMQLHDGNADKLYKQAIESLLLIQTCQNVPDWPLPSFDSEYMMGELNNFRHWVLERYLEIELSKEENDLLENTFHKLIQYANDQPQLCIHRDYHSRNLMLVHDGEIPEVGILDFQDAMIGPISYDLVSLIKDCYIMWSRDRINTWVHYYHQRATEKKICSLSYDEFLKAFELMGLQRHLKASFIFARKYLRDHDARYLADLPRTMAYIRDIVERYTVLSDFHDFLKRKQVYSKIT